MSSSSAFLLASLVLFSAIHFAKGFDLGSTADKLEQLESQLESNYEKNENLLTDLFDQIQHLKAHSSEGKNRKRRAICGRKLTLMALSVCGSLDRSPATNIDLSSECCTKTACSEEFIKTAMCPDLLKH